MAAKKGSDSKKQNIPPLATHVSTKAERSQETPVLGRGGWGGVPEDGGIPGGNGVHKGVFDTIYHSVGA